jgi:hypothetical protein
MYIYLMIQTSLLLPAVAAAPPFINPLATSPISPPVSAAPTRQIGFAAHPILPGPEHERTDAERAGRPYPGTEGNFKWEQRFPDGGARTFWANMPSPTLAPRDPILAPPGTVFLGVGGDEFIEVVRAPRFEVVAADDEEDLEFVLSRI